MADAAEVVDDLEEKWEEESIPDDHILFYRVHRNDLDNGKPKPGAFRNMPKGVPSSGMSTNWQKYSSGEATRQGARQPPGEYAVLRLIVGEIRQLPGQVVKHTPDQALRNRSHTDVFGEKTTEVRAKMLRIYKIELHADDPAEC